jgi:lysophospholipase L1-like esterase
MKLTLKHSLCIILCLLTVAAGAQRMRIVRTKITPVKGTVLLMPGAQPVQQVALFTAQGFDVAVPPANDLFYAQQGYHAIKTNPVDWHLRSPRVDVAGFEGGAATAAMLVNHLTPAEQPGGLLLVNPQGMEQTVPGTVIPAVIPPFTPAATLYINIRSEYTKTWIGYDGSAVTDTSLPRLINAFVLAAPVAKDTLAPNPAAVPVEGYSPQRHAEKLALVAKQPFNLLMIGNSITNNFEKPEYQPVWNQFFAPRNAINLGFSGYRTENLLWNLAHGQLEGQQPKVAVVEIGTNNIDEKNYPTRHTAGQLAGGIKAIVELLRQKLPGTKIIVLRCFPGCYGGPNPTSHRAILERASDMVSALADGKNVFYCDVNHVFLNPDGSINQTMMPDWLHPSPQGALAWAQAMEPLLSELMGDKNLDTATRTNTAIVPVPKLEEDSYNWWARHAEVLRIKDSINPEVVLIGNSITHFWGGLPQLRYADGQLRQPNGPASWQGLFGQHRVLNLGFGWDRTQNALWRLDHGELDGLHPRTVIIDIGSNNTSQTENARINTADEIVEGIREVCLRVRSKVPHAHIVLMAIFPREQDPQHPRRLLINDINLRLKAFANAQQITLVDIGPAMLAKNGSFKPGMMLDYTHPTDKGYQVWADAIRKFVEED